MTNHAGGYFRYLFGNIILKGSILCKTGLHIGGSSDTIEIGGIDSFVVRNPLTREPYIPGSSMKGKLRSIVEKIVTKAGKPLFAERHGGGKDEKVWRHECDDFADAAECPLCRIFGATGNTQKKSENENYPAAVNLRDCPLLDPDKLKDEDGVVIFEAKMENALDRLTSAAHPRCIERVPAGAVFDFEMIYRVEAYGNKNNGSAPVFSDTVRVQEDLSNLFSAMGILEYDGLGGNISRGYGGIRFNFFSLTGLDARGNSLVNIPNKDPENHVLRPSAMVKSVPAFIQAFAGQCNDGDSHETRET